MSDKIKGPCGINLDSFDTVVISQPNKCNKKCGSKCSCKVFVFEILAPTGGTASTGGTVPLAPFSSPSSNTTYVEQFDPSPIAESSFFNPNFLPSALDIFNVTNKSDIWINSLTKRIYKLFPNGYWYLQGDLGRTTSVSIESSSKQEVKESGTNLSYSGLGLVNTTGTYSVTSELTFQQEGKGVSLVSIQYLDGAKVIKSQTKQLTFSLALEETVDISFVSQLVSGTQVQVVVTLLDQDPQSVLYVSSFKLNAFLL